MGLYEGLATSVPPPASMLQQMSLQGLGQGIGSDRQLTPGFSAAMSAARPIQGMSKGAGTTYTDLSGLQNIKNLNKADKEAGIDAVARQFESLFIQMMLKSMRDANAEFGNDNFLSSSETDFYQQMYDQQISVSLGQQRGIGLAEIIRRQLSNGDGATADELSKVQADQDKMQEYFAKPVAAQISAKQSIGQKTEQNNDSLQLPTMEDVKDTLETISTALAAKLKAFKGPQDFVTRLLPMAEKIAERLGVQVQALLAQAALETGWGKSVSDLDSHNNLFGIKANRDWDGDSVSRGTLEYRDGIAHRQRAQFRAYESFESSFEDYANFLQSSSRYQEALQNSQDSSKYFQALQDAGYATDPDYAKKLDRIMNSDVINDTLKTSFIHKESNQEAALKQRG